jgi:hypothetical protein
MNTTEALKLIAVANTKDKVYGVLRSCGVDISAPIRNSLKQARTRRNWELVDIISAAIRQLERIS